MTKLLHGFVKDVLYLLEFLLQKEILGSLLARTESGADGERIHFSFL